MFHEEHRPTYKEEAAEPSRPQDGEDAQGVLGSHRGPDHGRDQTKEGAASDAVEDQKHGEYANCGGQWPDNEGAQANEQQADHQAIERPEQHIGSVSAEDTAHRRSEIPGR